MSRSFEVLLSTVDQNDLRLVEKMNIQSSVVIIDQCGREKVQEVRMNGHSVRYIGTAQKGLSKSRNMAIQNARADICLLSDDDVVYVDGYRDLICEAFSKHPDDHILAFQLEGIDRVFKRYKKKERRVGFFSSMKLSSVEIAFRREAVAGHIVFDERFGAGAAFKSGEENIFLAECLKKGLKIRYIPQKIGSLVVGGSTWFTGYNEEFFYCEGRGVYGDGSRILLGADGGVHRPPHPVMCPRTGRVSGVFGDAPRQKKIMGRGKSRRMKVAVITLHRVFNHGSVLQAYATQLILERLGADAEIIDYVSKERTYKRIFGFAPETMKSRLKKSLYIISRFPMNVLKYMSFGSFINKHLNLTRRTYITVRDLRQNPPEADVYLTGSDQVWNSDYNEGVDHAFFTDFGSPDVPRVSYAASFAKEKISAREAKEIKPLLD